MNVIIFGDSNVSFLPKNDNFIKEGVLGEKISTLIERVKIYSFDSVINYKIFVMIGTNNMHIKEGLSSKTLRKLENKVLDLYCILRNKADLVYFLPIPTRPCFKDNCDKFNLMLKQKGYLVDFEWSSDDIGDDGLHLNDHGKKKLIDFLSSQITE
jgi:hypothetical protein